MTTPHKPHGSQSVFYKLLALNLTFCVAVCAVSLCVGFFVFNSQNLLSSLILGGVVITATLGLYIFFLRHWLKKLFFSPLIALKKQMLEVENGQWQNQPSISSHKEWQDVFDVFSHMMSRVREINERKKNIETRLIKTEESLKFKNELEHKNQIIEKMNLELTQSFHNVALLYTVSQYLSSAIEVGELLTTVHHIFEEKFICQQYILAIVSDKEKLHIVHSKGLSSELSENESILFDQGLIGFVAKNQKTIVVENMQKCPYTKHGFENEIYGSFICTALSVRNQTLGVLAVARNAFDAFSMNDQQSLEAIASQIAISYDRCSLYTQTKELSVRDELTHLFNRRYFQNVLLSEFKRATRYNRPLSLLMIDVDHFKQFNDTHGHLKGDLALKSIAQALSQSIREVDILARYGGEEFVLLLPNTDLNNAYTVAEKLRKKIENEMRVDIFNHSQQNLKTTISIGIASYPEIENLENMVHASDMALYEAKKRGRNCSVIANEINSNQAPVSKNLKVGTDF